MCLPRCHSFCPFHTGWALCCVPTCKSLVKQCLVMGTDASVQCEPGLNVWTKVHPCGVKQALTPASGWKRSNVVGGVSSCFFRGEHFYPSLDFEAVQIIQRLVCNQKFKAETCCSEQALNSREWIFEQSVLRGNIHGVTPTWNSEQSKKVAFVSKKRGAFLSENHHRSPAQKLCFNLRAEWDEC